MSGRTRETPTPIDVGRLLPVLDRAEHLYIAVRTERGPHVTPDLFAVSGDQIVCVTGAATVKARRVRSDPVVGLAARSEGGVVSAIATVDVVDVAEPLPALANPLVAASSAIDVVRFVRDNAAELGGAARDAVTGRLGLPPARWVLLTLTVVAAGVEGADGAEWADGWSWRAPSDGAEDLPGRRPARSHEEDLLDAVPEDLADLAGSGDAVLGWTRADGSPLALPAQSCDATSVSISRRLFEVTGAAAASHASVTFDDRPGLGPSGKRGVMMRGDGRADTDGDRVVVELDVERVTYWDGVETATADVERPG